MMSVTEPSVHHRLTYQPALDGLRAVAAGLVLLYHQQGPRTSGLFRGGYIGVDIFFVLSGYLITRLLVDEHAEAGRIRLVQFWRRRFRRLMPALLAMLVLTAVLSRLVYAPYLQAGVRRDVPWVMTYLENWHIVFWNGSGTTPLSHTWSLAVEEQWYVVWPAAVWVATGFVRGRLRSLMAWTLGLALASALLAFLLRDEGPRVFYGTDTRAQQLLIGAALAFWTASAVADPQRSVGRIVDAAGVLAFGAIVGIGVFVSNSPSRALGGYLGLSVLVAGVLVVAGRSGSTIGKLLAIAPLVWFGRVSYGIYLFHLPIFYWLDTAATGLTGWALFGVRLAATLAVAVASYVLVEQPIRRCRRVPVAVLGGGAVALVGVLVATSVGLRAPIGSPRSRLLAYSLNSARVETPVDSRRVLVVGGTAAGLLAALRTTPFTQAGLQGVSVGILRCGLTSTSRRCADVSGDVPALRAAYRPRWLVLVPERSDLDALAAKSTARRAERHLGHALAGAQPSGVVLLYDSCLAPVGSAGEVRMRAWAERHRVRIVVRPKGDPCAGGSGQPLSWPEIVGAVGRG